MTAKNKPTPDEKYPKSIEYKGQKIKFSVLPNPDPISSNLPSSDLQDKGAPEVEVRSDKNQLPLKRLRVEIGDKAFEVVEFHDGLFESGLLPYSSYSSPIELAQDVIDHIPNFVK